MPQTLSIQNLPFDVSQESDNVLSIKRKSHENSHKKQKNDENQIRVYVFDEKEAQRLMDLEPITIKTHTKVSYSILKSFVDFLKFK